MPLPARDFESRASTSSATRASGAIYPAGAVDSTGAARRTWLARAYPGRPHAGRACLLAFQLALPHLRDPLPDLLLERRVLGALHRRQKSGEVLLLLPEDLKPR